MKNIEIKPILTVIGIFVMLLFILLPPMFRVIFKEEIKEEETPQEISSLQCNKEEISITTNYLNNNITSLVINISTEQILEELIFITELQLENINGTYTISKTVLSSTTNENLLKLTKDITTQKINLENFNYQCNEVKH